MKRRREALLLILAVLLVIACRSFGTPWASERPHETGEYSATVTAKYDCFGIGWDDARCRPYRRVDDRDFDYVRLLFAHEYACPVTADDMVMVTISTNYTCRWRHPR